MYVRTYECVWECVRNNITSPLSYAYSAVVYTKVEMKISEHIH